MLGIIFTGGMGPPEHVTKRIIETEIKGSAQTQCSQLKQCALFIAADSGLIACENAGVKPDWIIGDMDSLDTKTRLETYPQQCVIRHQHDKDFTDTELAFLLAVEKGCGEIWIIGGSGRRIVHLFGIRSMFERDVFPSRWLTDKEDIHCVDAASEKQSDIRRDLQIGACVSVFPLGDGPWKAESRALKWELAPVKWNRGFFGLSNVVINGDFSITAQQGRFMIILPLNF